MTRLPRASLVLVALLVLVTTTWMALPIATQEITPVRVVNLPERQEVRGTVQVPGPTSHAQIVERLRVVVPPAARNEAGSLVEAGVVETAGFTGASLSLAGQMQGRLRVDGMIGALLIPDRESVLEALVQDGIVQFPLEAVAEVAQPGTSRFAAQSHQRVAFPRYRVYFYNTTPRSAEVDLYLYLTH